MKIRLQMEKKKEKRLNRVDGISIHSKNKIEISAKLVKFSN